MKTKPPVYIFVNGIRADPGDAHGWTDCAVSWMMQNHDCRAEKFEYHCHALTRFWHQKNRIKDVSEMIKRYAENGNPVHLVGHSNGCDIILKAFLSSGKVVESITLISPACEADFEKNGLNAALKNLSVHHVNVFIAGSDLAMKFARFVKSICDSTGLSKLGLGYGTMGLTGPKNDEPTVNHAVYRWTVPDFGHSTWFEPEYFSTTMKRIWLMTSHRI